MKPNDLRKYKETEGLKSEDFRLSAFKSTVRIGLDGKRAAQNFTGLGNYSRYVINILASCFPGNKYMVYSPKKCTGPGLEPIEKLPAVSFHYPKSSHLTSLWRSFGVLRDLKRDRIQLYHGLSNEIPFGIKKTGIASVVTIHDLIFLKYPHYYPWFDRKMYGLKTSYACRNADLIIAISEQTKKDIIEYYQIPESRIAVVYQNCSPAFERKASPPELEQLKEKYALPDKFLLNVGTIEARKNLLLIVKALRDIPADVHLVVIGRDTPYAKKVNDYIRQNNLSERVHFLRNVPVDDLPGIYQQAEIFLFPSQYEGFGIPVIEALHSRVPVIAAKGSCLEEAGGSGSIYINSYDEIELSVAIKHVLGDPLKKDQMKQDGIEYARRFSNELIASEMMELYHKVIQNA